MRAHGGGAATRRGKVRPLSGVAHCCSLLLEAAFLVAYQTEREREGEDRNRTFSKETRSKKTAPRAPLEAQ